MLRSVRQKTCRRCAQSFLPAANQPDSCRRRALAASPLDSWRGPRRPAPRRAATCLLPSRACAFGVAVRAPPAWQVAPRQVRAGGRGRRDGPGRLGHGAAGAAGPPRARVGRRGRGRGRHTSDSLRRLWTAREARSAIPATVPARDSECLRAV